MYLLISVLFICVDLFVHAFTYAYAYTYAHALHSVSSCHVDTGNSDSFRSQGAGETTL